ncbi:MAG TPA: hypothetical protein VF801_02165 [Rhodocyclaceae bacterium]
MATEYIFFDTDLRDRFVKFAATHGIQSKVKSDPIADHVVVLPDHIEDGVAEALEAEYELLMDEQMALTNADDDHDAKDLMGVGITLPDGTDCTVRLPAPIARRLFQAFSPEEIHELVDAIAKSVAAPTTAPLCKNI